MTDTLPPMGPAPLSPEVLEQIGAGSEPLTDGDLAAVADGAIPYTLKDGGRPWRIEDDGAAEWAGRHRAMALAEAAQIEEQAAEWVAQIVAWKEDRIHAPQRKAQFFEAQLRDYALRLRAADPDRATLNLPSVTVRTRHSNAAVKVVDEPALLAWLDANLTPAEVNELVSRKVLVAAVRKLVTVHDGTPATADGEVPPGLAVEPERTTASVGA